MSTPDIIAARAAGTRTDTPWDAITTELCKRVVELEKAREEGVLLESVVIDTGAATPAEAPEPEAPAVLWVVFDPDGEPRDAFSYEKSAREEADHYAGLTREIYHVARYVLADAAPAVPEGMVMVDVDALLEAVASEAYEEGRHPASGAVWPEFAPEVRARFRETWRARLIAAGILPEPTP